MKVLTAAAMREADRKAIAAGFPGLVLMENAAYGVLRELERSIPRLVTQRIAIFCGKGNNGGDGLALARLLHLHHRPQRLIVISAFPLDQLGEDAGQQLRMLKALGVPVETEAPDDLAATTLAIDALLGTGSSGKPKDPVAEWVRCANSLPLARRWAIDIPTGLGSDLVFQAECTVTFAAPKLELVYGPTANKVGRLVVAEIGIPAQFLESPIYWSEGADFAPVLGRRAPESHKGNYGHVAILGGAEGKRGALQLAGMAALRGGAGWTTLYSPDPRFQPGSPDLMQGAWPDHPAQLAQPTVFAVGPGLGQNPEICKWLRDWIEQEARPIVLDADALNRLAPWTLKASAAQIRVLTPHPKEMSRLLGRPLGDRLEEARSFAQASNVILVLKGQHTIVAFPDGHAWVNPTGSPALAKAGSGDVLTGLIASLLAQFPAFPRECVLAAVYLHGRCGELAAAAGHERTSLASELATYLPRALSELS